MKRSTAVSRLIDIAEEASRQAAFPNFDWPLREMWATGELLDGESSFDRATVILMLALPVAELPWLALHPVEEAVAEILRLPKLPIRSYARPVDGPAWNAEAWSVVRFWDASGGLDQQVVEAMRTGEPLTSDEPTADEYRRQMDQELTACVAHLHQVLDDFWEPSWRREHRGSGRYPEEHLWRAAQAVRDVRAALENPSA